MPAGRTLYGMNMQHYFFRTYHYLQHFIAPPQCAYCKRLMSERSPLCTLCLRRIKPIVSLRLELTKNYAVPVFAASFYQEPLKSLVVAKSWSDVVASSLLGELIWDLTNVQHAQFDCIVPVPLHWTRYAYRGYNQAEEIAKVLSKKSGKPVTHLLTRGKRTPILATFSLAKREEAVHDAFELAVNFDMYAGKHLLVVDDVLTTGATLKSALRVLRTLKPASITVAVACRAT
jgi:ComF family protein